MNRLLHIFWDTDMRCRHEGLALRAKADADIDISDLETGQLLCFINAKRDRIMVIAGTDEPDSRGVLAYYRSPRGSIDIQALQFIPQAFNAGNFQYDKALRKTLIERLESRKGKNGEGTSRAGSVKAGKDLRRKGGGAGISDARN